MPKKKVSRKELLKEPDEFLTFSRRLMAFVLENQKPIAIGLGTVFGLIILFSLIGYFSEKSENQAFARLQEATRAYDQALEGKGSPEAAYEAVRSDFEALMDQYGNKEAGRIARMRFADIAYEAGDADQAIALYQKALNDFKGRPGIENLILSSLGYAHESRGELEKAAGYFEQITAAAGTLLKAEAYFNLGRLYEKLGEPQKSKAAFEKVISDYQDSVYADMVKEKLAA